MNKNQSSSRVFKMGHADVQQDKPSKETMKALGYMHKANTEKAELVYHKMREIIKEISILLHDKTEGELLAVLNEIVRETKRMKQENTKEEIL